MTNKDALNHYIQLFIKAIEIQNTEQLRKILSEMNGYYLAMHNNGADLNSIGEWCAAISELTDQYIEVKNAPYCLY